MKKNNTLKEHNLKDDSLNYWLKHIESFHPAEIELGLDRSRLVAERLNLLDIPGKIILVGGTNGKGSCVAMLEALALELGKSVACYTSPHLLEFNERIRLNGHNAGDQALVEAFTQIEKARCAFEPAVALTFFEFTTLAALYLFRLSSVELILLEVGLGGRQDATNIIEPDVSIITTVDKDHADWLGDELESVAYEKGGIMRLAKPCLIGDKKTEQLLKKVLPEHQQNMQRVTSEQGWLHQLLNNKRANPLCLLEQNVALAVAAYEQCFNLSLTADKVENALTKISLKGRFQPVDLKPDTLVDVAHNPQAAQHLCEQLLDYTKEHQVSRITAICGMMADKAVAEVLELLDPAVDRWCFADLPIDRAISAADLQQIYCAFQQSAESQSFTSVSGAFSWVAENSAEHEHELVIVFGSFVTVAQLLEYAAVQSS